jgi:flagellar basal-body rod protein FlgF
VADGIYVGMAAASARAAQLDSVADNLANAETPGFKASRPAFQSFLPGGQKSDKVLSAAVATGIDLRPGVTVPTDRPLDVLPQNDTFLAVQIPGGTRAYTRNGSIQVGPEGELLIGGNPVLDSQGAPLVVPPGEVPTVLDNGEVMVEGEPAGRLGLFRIDGPMDRSGPNLLLAGAGATVTALADDEARVAIGELEMGNAPALESTIAMISAQRHFDAAMQAIQTYRRLDERASEVGKIR